MGDDGASAVDRVVRGLRAQIIDGRRPGGTLLVERQLAEEHGVSRLPVRAAIRRLAQEGLVDQSTHRRAIVHVLTMADVADIAELHAVLDRLAVRQAALRRSESDLDAFADYVRAAEEATAANALGDLRDAGVAFRSHVYRATGDRPLLDIHQTLSGRTLQMFALSDPSITAAVPIYRRMRDAMRDRDPAAAEAALDDLSRQLQSARERRFLDQLESARPPSSFPQPVSRVVPDTEGSAEPEFVAVLARLEDEIVRGQRAPGSPLSERRIADAFGVSRGPVRQAIEELAHRGLADLGDSRIATTVRGMTEDEAGDLYDVCIALDLLAIARTAQRRTRAELDELRGLLDAEMRVDPIRKAERIDRMFDFRRMLFTISKNTLLVGVNRIVESRLRMLVANAPLTPAHLHGHAFLYELIAGRETELSESVYRSIFTRPDVD